MIFNQIYFTTDAFKKNLYIISIIILNQIGNLKIRNGRGISGGGDLPSASVPVAVRIL
jgi:hypothetical protein